MADKLTLTLTNEDGEVIAYWKIGKDLEPEFDIEDLNAEPECDFYLDGKWNEDGDIGGDVAEEARIYLQAREERRRREES